MTSKGGTITESIGKFGSMVLFFKSADALRLGDVIEGWVEVNLARPITVQRMTVTFYGEV